ncbi:MAG: hypothetical protein C0515_10940 [Novosphingobium sp.]|nr:hypothetical protein [Novosphingobium sp.]
MLVLGEVGVDVLGDQLVGLIDGVVHVPTRHPGLDPGSRFSSTPRQRQPDPGSSPGLTFRNASHSVARQKYPCCFFTSIPAPPASLSIARPWRSLVVVSKVS